MRAELAAGRANARVYRLGEVLADELDVVVGLWRLQLELLDRVEQNRGRRGFGRVAKDFLRLSRDSFEELARIVGDEPGAVVL